VHVRPGQTVSLDQPIADLTAGDGPTRPAGGSQDGGPEKET
jgi:hypothetical protein